MNYEDKEKQEFIQLLKNNNVPIPWEKAITYEEICLAAVNQSGYYLKFIKEKTPELCLIAVSNYAFALEHITEQTDEMCLAAVKKNGLVLQYVKNKTPEICMAAVSNFGYALKFVENLNDELLLAALKVNPGSMLRANKRTYTQEQYIVAANISGIYLEFVSKKLHTIDMVFNSVKTSPSSIRHASKRILKSKEFKRLLIDNGMFDVLDKL